MRPDSVNGGHGLSCCHVYWRDMSFEIHRDGEEGLVSVWRCPNCGKLLRSDPFTPPVLDYQT